MDPPPPYTPLLGDADPQHLQYPPPPPPASLRPVPPQLPPRPPSNQLSAWAQDSKTGHGRSASQVSLVPVSDESKRTLLVIYIHGFMGNETSFQSFPAHLHNLLCVTLDPLGYLVHTKVYPKFKTRYNILVATENFSKWLSKFENENTDVILLGHSMGGLLAADVALLKDYTGKKRHRILGIIAFDTPFLGMHPGVISAGLGSIFRPAPKSPGEDAQGLYANSAEGSSQSNMSLHTMNSGGSQVDEFYSKPPARNYTVVLPKIEGTWDSTLHFINKYHSRLTKATGQYLMSHLEFGGCLADIIGLKNRYSAVRALEDGVIGVSGNTERVRFVNYYTSSTGRIKETTETTVSPDSGKVRAFDGEHGVPGVELDHDLIGHERSSQYIEYGVVEVGEPSSSSMKHQRNASASSYNTASSTDDMKHIPADPITDDEFGGEPVALHIVDADKFSVVDGRPPTELFVHENIQYSKDDKECYSGNGEYNEKSGYNDSGEPSPMYPISRQITTDTMETLEKQISIDLTLSDFQLPPIPPPPEEPPSFDYSQIPDAMVRKVAEKEAARVRKAWEKAVKDYEKAVNNREKELEKLRKNKGKGVDRGIKDEDRKKERQLKDKAKEIERRERERRRELKEWDKEKDREEKEIQKKLKEEDKEREVTDRDRLKLMRGWEREKEREEREIQRELEKKEREIVRELERMEKEVQLRREKKQGEIENEREKQEIAMGREGNEKEEPQLTSQGIEENTHEKQELERLRKEQERMDAEHRRMNGIPEPPVQPLSPRSAPPSTATISASSSRSNLPISSPALRPETPKSNSASPKPKGKDKKKRDRRFCCLPSDKNDKCWVKVEMRGVDEVGAHCGLFFVGEAYERLVGDVAARMEEWVGEERTRRILESL